MTEQRNEHVVLVVEDDRHTRELLTFNLEDAGFQVLAAPDGAAALAVLREQTVDLIVCDIMMPRMDGFALREALLRDPALKEIAFLFLTAKTMPEDEIRGLRTGVDEYLTKPFNPEVIVARVEAVLARRASFARAGRIDALTQLLNRQACVHEIRRELNRVRRYPAVASLLFIDVDEFKRVNDAHGHAAGDRALVRLADALRQNSRSVDIVGRYGGEEFLVYLPETSEARAMQVLGRIQTSFSESLAREEGFRPTFSAGVAEVPRDGTDFDELCARADAAMYSAKRQGKARCVGWRPDMANLGECPAP